MSDDMMPGENRLKGLNPERLMVIETEEIDPLLDIQYAALKGRGDELLAKAVAWAAARHVPGEGHVIPNDLAMNAASELYVQLSDFAKDGGEVDETRKKVGERPRLAVGAINAWFGLRRDRLVGAMAVITTAQKRRLDTVKAEKAVEQQRVVREAEEIAKAKLAAARAPDADEKAIAAAVEAEDHAEAMKAEAAAAPTPDTTRTRSAMGVTTSSSETWTYELEDMMALAKAVVAGTVPVNFLSVNDAIVRVSIKDKAKPMRSCPGLRIFPETKLNRRGGR